MSSTSSKDSGKDKAKDKFPRFDLAKLRKVIWFKKMMKDRKEEVYLSCEISKINRFGMKLKRVLVITNKFIYNLRPNFDFKKKNIPL